MANPVCTSTSFKITGGAYSGRVIDPRQRTALRVYARILQLLAIGGTDYTLDAGYNQLVQDAATICAGMTQEARDDARVAIDFANATTAGASVPATLDLQLAALGQLVALDPKALDECMLLLSCKLGVSKAYVQ
jgi:hypothetical protein